MTTGSLPFNWLDLNYNKHSRSLSKNFFKPLRRFCCRQGAPKEAVSGTPGRTYLQADVRPVDVVVGHVKVQRGGLLDARERDGHVVIVGLQGDPVDGGSAGEHKEGLGDNAGLHVAQQLQADGAAALGGVGREEAQVAAPAIPVGTRVGS